MSLWLLTLPLGVATGYLYWRYVWFFRNPSRVAPAGENLVSPADGTVVYVNVVSPHQEVVTIKKGIGATLQDIVKEDLGQTKVSIGIFMSPFNVHYNRIPLAGRVDWVRHHPPINGNRRMTAMQWRTLWGRPPLYRNSLHIIANARTVTRIQGDFQGRDFPYYIVQIAGWSVNGVDSYVTPGESLDKGEIFGLIRIGSQVDLVAPYFPQMEIRVKPGDKVRAGESILIA